MKKGKFKRSAGQRRYLDLVRKVGKAHYKLRGLQSSMQVADGNGKQIRQMTIMQTITETIEELKL